MGGKRERGREGSASAALGSMIIIIGECGWEGGNHSNR